MTNKLIISLLLFAPVLGLAQERTLYLQGAYLGELISHPGISIGVATPFWESEKTKYSNQVVRHELLYGAKVGAYHHARMHTGVMLTPHIQWLRTGKKGFQVGAVLAGGYLRTFIPNTFEILEDGSLDSKPFSGTNHAVLIPGIRLGKDLSVKRDLPISWYIQPQFMLKAPYFQGSTQLFFIETGITYQLN